MSNEHGQDDHHDLHTDTSFFPSIGGVNAALTAMANAIRVGEHIADRIS